MESENKSAAWGADYPTDIRQQAEVGTHLASQDILQAALNAIGDAIAVVDRYGRICFANQAFTAIAEVSATQVMGLEVQRLNELYENSLKVARQQFIPSGADRAPLLESSELVVLKDGRLLERSARRQIVNEAGECYEVQLWMFRDVTTLRRSDELRTRLAAVVEHSDDAIISTSLEGFISTWNHSAERLYGYTAEKILGRHISILLPHDRHDEEQRLIDRLVAGERIEHYETCRVREDGQLREISLTISLIRDDQNVVYGISKIARDISDRKLAERELKERTEWFGSILDSIGDAVITIDLDGYVNYVNRTAQLLTGYASGEAAEQRLEAILTLADEATGTVISNPINGVTRSWQDQSGDERESQGSVILIDREGARRTIEYSVASIRLVSGEQLGLVLAFRDISERRHNEKSLARSEQRLRLINDVIPQLLWIATPNGDIEYYNERWDAYVGVSGTEVSGESPRQAALHPDDREAVAAGWARAIKRGDPFEFEYRLRRHDGEYRWFMARAVPLRNAAGQIESWYGSSTDIHQHKLLAAERQYLLESERAARTAAVRMSEMKDEFLATVSHELRTPLSAILGWVHVLRRGSTRPGDRERALDVIERNGRMQTRLIEDLLDMSRIISGKLRLDIQYSHPSAFIELALETIKPAAEAKGIRISTVIDARVTPVWVDASRMQQVLWNLLSNAVKFTPRDGFVQVAMVQTESHLEVSVADGGEGIAPEFLPHVFERFRQAGASTTRSTGGLGLGLAIVKQLVELHGGTIKATSAGLGRGACFTLMLPVTATATLPLVAAAVTAEIIDATHTEFRCTDLSGIKVVVIDDEVDVRDLVQRILEDAGGAVFSTTTLAQVLSMIEQQQPDIVISDISMPGMDGYELLKRVLALPRPGATSLPVIALTALARSEDRLRALQAGFAAHLAKPINPAELVNTVARLVGRAEV